MIDKQQFEALAGISGTHCISLFIPTFRAGQEQEDRIRYKNALSEVKNQLINRGVSPEQVEGLLKEAKSRIDDLEFWQHQSDGLAVFITDGDTTFHELPIHFKPFTFVGDHLYLKPIMPVLTDNVKFFVLAISQNATRFFQGERYAITEIETNEHLPAGIQDLMRFIEREDQLQHHSGRGGDKAAIFHGQGGGKEMESVRLREYARMINKGVMELMCDDDTDPLILATTEEMAALYRQENDYNNLYPEFINGNPEHDDALLLHEKAWELLKPQTDKERSDTIETFESALAENEASFSLHDIVPAAIAGRVKTLFVAEMDEIWGNYQPEEHEIQVQEKTDEGAIPLLNKAVISTYLNGGQVYVLPRVELPRPTSSLNAIYRYAIVPA